MRLEAILVASDSVPDSRAKVRHSLKLRAHSRSMAAGEVSAVIHNISPTGFLVEAPENSFVAGEAFFIEIPGAGPIGSKIVWSNGRFLGCEFKRPISRAAVSAALLQAEPINSDNGTGRLDDRPHSFANAGLEPELNFLAAVVLALVLWVLIGLAAYLIWW